MYLINSENFAYIWPLFKFALNKDLLYKYLLRIYVAHYLSFCWQSFSDLKFIICASMIFNCVLHRMGCLYFIVDCRSIEKTLFRCSLLFQLSKYIYTYISKHVVVCYIERVQKYISIDCIEICACSRCSISHTYL